MNLYPKNSEDQRVQTDVKKVGLPVVFIAKLSVLAALATVASDVSVLAATALTAAEQDIITGFTKPTVPRSIRIKGNAAGIAGDVVITGLNYQGVEITETIALNGATAVEGNKAFADVTAVALPVETNVGTDTVSIGTGEKLGLPYKLAHNTVLMAFLDNTLEATAPTVTTSTTAIESNTVDLNTALSSKVVDLYLMV